MRGNMYGNGDTKPIQTTYVCSKCNKMMANDAETIKIHSDLFCAKLQKKKSDKTSVNDKSKEKTGRKKS